MVNVQRQFQIFKLHNVRIRNGQRLKIACKGVEITMKNVKTIPIKRIGATKQCGYKKW